MSPQTLSNIFCRPQGSTTWDWFDIQFTADKILAIHPSQPPNKPFQNGAKELAGLCLLPRGVDVQAHLRVPGQETKETAETGLAAAFYGGYTAVLTMPNTRPVIDSVTVLQEAIALTDEPSEKYDVDVYFSSAITLGQKGEALAPLRDLAKAGVKAFTDDGRGVMSDDLMRQAFEICAETGLPLLQHAEMEGHGGVIAPGPVQQALGIAAYPDSAETDMVARDLQVLRTVRGARYHVLHVSAHRTLNLIREAKNAGLHATAEVSPHHLFFNCTQIDPTNSSFKMNPPLRAPEDQSALLKGLNDGTVDFVATDHAPHEAGVKTTDFNAAANGTLGLETTLSVLIDFYQKKQLTLDRLVEVWSTAPARFLDLGPIDTLAVGQPLRGVFVDLKAAAHSWEPKDLHSLSKNSCFNGSSLPKPIVAIACQHGVKSVQI